MTRRTSFVLSLLLAAVPALALAAPAETMSELSAARARPRAFVIDETTVKIERVADPCSDWPGGLASAHPSRPAAGRGKCPERIVPRDEGSGGGGEGAVPVLDAIINTAQKLWKIVLENKPVVDVKTTYATALPKGVSGWSQMAGWQTPEGNVYQLTAKNLLGVPVVSVRYQVLRTYGGSYEGKGKYLTAVTVEPLLVDVAWGYHFSMEASVPDTSVVNVGTAADPVAGMLAQLGWRISTALKDSSGQSLYFLRGDGSFAEVGGPFSKPALDKASSALAELAPE